MTQARSTLVSLEATPYYHCITRCVRRAFLCGNDRYSGKNFDHRKPWFIQRLKSLAKVFSIDIAAYAIMSNHYHLVLHVDISRSQSWSQEGVINRWLTLYKGPELVHRFLRGDLHSQAEDQALYELVEIWRERLSNISWFMGCLNEHVARKANKEDKCKGRFWESRFKSQALLDETALLSCMVYVDLNPIRAGLNTSLETSLYTSIRERIRHIRLGINNKIPRLMPFSENITQAQDFSAIPFTLKGYLELADWTGRCVREDKRGAIAHEAPKVLQTLRLSQSQWQYLALDIQKQSISMLHELDKLALFEKSKKLVTTE